MAQQVTVLVWQNVGIRHEIECFSPELFLSLDIVETESVLASNLIRRREVVEPLELVQTLVEVGLATTASPE